MNMRRESNFRGALGQAIRATHNIAQPIESGTTGLGIPDMFIRTSRMSAWVELKNERYAIRYPYYVAFRPGQAAWLERYYKLGGISILGVATLYGNFFFVNENIRRVYESERQMHDLSSYMCGGIVGKDFVRWLDSLVEPTISVEPPKLKLNLQVIH